MLGGSRDRAALSSGTLIIIPSAVRTIAIVSRRSLTEAVRMRKQDVHFDLIDRLVHQYRVPSRTNYRYCKRERASAPTHGAYAPTPHGHGAEDGRRWMQEGGRV